jgi:glycosyltransferase involved in cell wall biosynthesis
MHDPIFFATDKFQKQFYNDTLFLPVNKIVNSIWLQRRIYDRTQIEFPIMNTGAVNPQIFKPASDITREGRKNEIHIVALGKGGFKNSKLIKDAVEIVRRNNLNISVFLHFFGHRLPGNIILDSQTFFHKDLDDVELARLYSKCDIQVTTSTAESFPLPPLEAMACGCSVITTPYGTEDYAIDNVNCLIVRPDDVSDLVSKIELLIFDPSLQKKLKTEGLKTSMRFSYAKQSKDLEAYFKSKMDSDQ